MPWIEVRYEADEADDETLIEWIFSDYFPQGYGLDDPRSICQWIASESWDAHVFSPWKLANDKRSYYGYWTDSEKLKDFSVALIEAGLMGELKLKEMEKWDDFWHLNSVVLRVGERIQIVPEWLAPESPIDVVIRLSPGIGFGSGQDETTQACLDLLEQLLQPGESVLDVGCGSGILAIAALKLGAGKVEAMDVEEQAVAACQSNALANDCPLNVYQSDLLSGCAEKADVVVANLVSDLHLRLIPQLAFHLNSGGRFIAAGIHHHRVDEIKKAAMIIGLHPCHTIEGKEWTAIAFCWREERA